MARIYKKNNSYYFSIEAGRDENTGKRQRIVRGGFKTKKDAQKAAVEVELKYNNHKMIVKPSDITLHDFMWNHWLEYHKQFIKESTLRNNTSRCLKRIDIFFGKDQKLKNLTAHQCVMFANHLKDKINRTSARTNLSYLRKALDYAVTVEKIISDNPCENISIPKLTIKEKEEMKLKTENKLLYLEKDQLKKFLVAAKTDEKAFPYYTAILLLSYTGMRIGELLGLQWQDIDINHKVIRIKNTIFRPDKHYIIHSAKTSKSIRSIIISDNIVKHLKEYRKLYLSFKVLNCNRWSTSPYDFVISSLMHPGEPVSVNTIQRWIDRIATKVNLPHLHPHIFRHTHVSLLAEAEVPISAIRERLGHSHDKITEDIYLHVTKKNRSEAATKFEKLLSSL